MKWQNFDYREWQKRYAEWEPNEAKWEEQAAKAKTLDDLFDLTKDIACGPFKPHADHVPEGDILHVYLTDEAYTAHWVCPGIVVHVSDAGEVVGVTVEGISSVLRNSLDISPKTIVN